MRLGGKVLRGGGISTLGWRLISLNAKCGVKVLKRCKQCKDVVLWHAQEVG